LKPQALVRSAEHAFDAVFGAAANPLKQLGALAFLALWLLAASGAVLYAVLDTSATGAWQSLDRLGQGWAGRTLRALHRYAADAFIALTLAHLAREWLLGRFRGVRRHPWLTGVPLLVLAFASAVIGFWLGWDALAQYSATATAEWLDALLALGSPLARNFLAGASVADRLFSLFVFMHLGLPLLLLFGLWIHLQRTNRPAVLPARGLAAGTTVSLLLAALLWPPAFHCPAQLAQVPGVLALDWWLLFIHPLAAALSQAATGWLVLAALALLALLPWLSPGAAGPPVAVVDPAHCSGCGRCVADCPFSAISLVPHPQGRRGMQLAQVKASHCASCGLCVGACPSSTPLRRSEPLQSGIELPQRPLDALRRQLRAGLAAQPGVVVFGCDMAAQPPAAPGVFTLSLPCAGMLPPAFIDDALRHGAAKVLVSGCREGACAWRLGQLVTAGRLDGSREPQLRPHVPRERIAAVWADPGERAAVQQALEELERRP
jgi:ferredoxin